eukprot:scpid46484/ scgid30754/ 
MRRQKASKLGAKASRTPGDNDSAGIASLRNAGRHSKLLIAIVVMAAVIIAIGATSVFLLTNRPEPRPRDGDAAIKAMRSSPSASEEKTTKTDPASAEKRTRENTMRTEKGVASAHRGPLVTPDWIADRIEALALTAANTGTGTERLDKAMAERRKLTDLQSLMDKAERLADRGRWQNASQLMRHVLEHRPFDKEAERFLHIFYSKLYPTGPFGTVGLNLSQSYLDTTRRHRMQGWAMAHGRNISVTQLHESVHAYVMENFLSDDECKALQGEHHRIQEKYNVHPLVCFQHDNFLKHKRLKKTLHTRHVLFPASHIGSISSTTQLQHKFRLPSRRVRCCSNGRGSHQPSYWSAGETRLQSSAPLISKWRQLQRPHRLSAWKVWGDR